MLISTGSYQILNCTVVKLLLSFFDFVRLVDISGPYLRLVTKTMLDFITGTLNDERKIYLYSGHETNVAAVLKALQLYRPHVPEYSSGVILELHEINSEYYIKVCINLQVLVLFKSNIDDLCIVSVYWKYVSTYNTLLSKVFSQGLD